MKKIAVITGASSGIGRACGHALKKDYVIYNLSRSSQEKDFYNYKVDVNDFVKIEEIAKEIFDREGRVDLLINNAGFGIAGAVEDCSPQNIYSLIDTNLSSLISVSSIFIPYLKKSKGRIINISSVGGIVPLPYQATYSASKAGVEIFSRALANELKRSGVKVTAVLPDDVKTNFTAARIVENKQEELEEKERIAKSIKKVEKDEQTGKGPESVAKVVKKVALSKRPPLRKTVGFSYKCVSLLTRILPTRLINFIVNKMYCK